MRKLEQLRDPRLAQAPPGLPELEPNRRREREARLREDGPQLLFRHGDLLDLDGQGRVGAGERGERADHGRGSPVTAQLAAGVSLDEHRLQPVQHDCRLALRLVELERDLAELVLERRLVDLRRRRDVRAEDPDADALKAAQRPETLSLAPRGVDRGGPVGLDAEPMRGHLPALGAAEERHRDVLERRRAPLEELLRGRRGHPADADARDRDAGGDLRGRAGEDRAEERGERQGDRDRRRERLQEQPRCARVAYARCSTPFCALTANGARVAAPGERFQNANSSIPPLTLSPTPVM